MPGVTVGENSVVGAFSFSFTKKDIPDNVMAFGVPVLKLSKKIYNENTTFKTRHNKLRKKPVAEVLETSDFLFFFFFFFFF